MSLIDRMTKIYDRTYTISDKFGIKQHVDFAYKDRMTSLVTNVLPRPVQTNPSPHRLMFWQQKNVEVSSLDVYIKGVSRTYSGIMQGATCTVNGKPHTILWIDEDQSVTYSILVRPERAR